MIEFINTLEIEFEKNINAKVASEQKAYMRNQFEFYGLKTQERREIQKPFLQKEFLPSKDNMEIIVRKLWSLPQRDFHLVGQELVMKYHKNFTKQDIDLIQFLLINNSWWDTVDYISVHILGSYFKKFPEEINNVCQRWMLEDNIWLHRACLLFQLKWKKEIDAKLMASHINQLLGSKEFFINKAIGWVLREYSRTNPEWVLEFVEQTELHSLSRREALRLIRN